MKKVAKITIIFVLLITLVACLYYIFFVSMLFLPQGELLNSIECETCGCVINCYLVNPHTTVDYCIRGEVVFKNGRKRNIYWNTHEQEADIQMIDCDTVEINRHAIKIKTEKYDFRRIAMTAGCR